MTDTAQEAKPGRVFLSYARGDDEPFVRRLYDDLTKAGFDVWFDRVSMPARQLTFLQEIRDAIMACERLVLVVGAKALTSDYVTQEWQFAYFAANKCVNPIIRLDGKDADDGPVDGYSLIPEDLKLLHAEDFRNDETYAAHLNNLVRQLSDNLPPAGKLVAVPELPPNYRAQPERLKALRDLLLLDLRKPVVVTGAAARVGLQGMGGIGKSVMANALAHHPEVRRAFRDGIFWISIGQEPRVVELQRWLAKQLGNEGLFNDEHIGKEKLRTLLADRQVLLVLDDVWQREHAEAFNVVGTLGRLLVTSRDAGLVTALASKENHYRVEFPTQPEAEAILSSAAHVDPATLPPEAKDVVAACGRLPLALALCGGMVQGGTSWEDVLDALREHDLEFLSADHPAEEQHQNAWKAMDVSLRVLSDDEQARFAELAVFGLDASAPEDAVATLWEHTAGMSPRNARKLLADFARRSLVQLILPTGGTGQAGARMNLHDLLQNFAEGMAGKRHDSRAALHRMLLDAYRKKCPQGWPSGPDDGYFFQNICNHLIHAEEIDDVVALLTGLPWVEAKCRAGLVYELQEDYREVLGVLPEAQATLQEERARKARLSRYTSEIIAYAKLWNEWRDRAMRGETITDPEPQLPEPPTICRMWTEEEIGAECRRIIEKPTRFDCLNAFDVFVKSQCCPLLEFGRRRGFVIQHAFNTGPEGAVHDAAGDLIPGLCEPHIFRRWSADAWPNPKPALLRTLQGHNDWVMSVSMTPDGRRSVSGGLDKTVKVWDLESGTCLRTLEGHGNEVWSVAIDADGRRAVSGSLDKTVKVWDLESGACLGTLGGHHEGVDSVCITMDGRRAVSGSRDNTLKVWDLEGGACLLTLEGHSQDVCSVSVTADGRRAVSGSRDKTVKVWDLESGVCLRTLEGHNGWVMSVSMTPDGRRAVSGSRDKTLRVWDLESGTCLRILEGHGNEVWSVAIDADGRRAVSGSLDITLRVWDLESGVCLRKLNADTAISLAIAADGRHMVSGNCDHTLRVWDLESGTCLRTLEGHGNEVWSVAIDADGRRAVSGGWDKTVRIWDLERSECTHILKGHSKPIVSVNISPEAHRIVSGGVGNTIRLWDVESGVCLRMLKGHRDVIRSIVFSADSRFVVSGSSDRTLRVWDAESGDCLRILEGHTGRVNSVSVTADGQRVVSGSDDKTLRVWDLMSGKCLYTLEGHNDRVNSVSVMANGQRVVSGSWDKTVRVWDLESRACIYMLEGHSSRIGSVSMGADGRYAVSGSDDRTLRVWDLESGICLVILSTVASVRAVSISSEKLVFGLSTGDVIFAEIRNIHVGSHIPLLQTAHGTDSDYEQLLRRGLDFVKDDKGNDNEGSDTH